MARRGNNRQNPNLGIFPIPGTNIGFPERDYTGSIPEIDITDDPEICDELSQMPLSGVSCNGNAPVYFKYLVSQVGCYECINKVLMPLNITYSRICYLIEDCSANNRERTEEPLSEVEDIEVREGARDPGFINNVFIIEDPNNPFFGWNDGQTYFGTLHLSWVFNSYSDWFYNSGTGFFTPGYFSNSGTSENTYNIKWQGRPSLTSIILYDNITSSSTYTGKTTTRQLRLNDQQIILTNNQLLYGQYISLQYAYNSIFNYPSEPNTATSWSTTFLTATLTIQSNPPCCPPPPTDDRRDPDMPQQNCCSCADIRLMLERQKKDIKRYIDEQAIDYVKIVNIVNQLGIGISNVNFELTQQIRNFNEINFVGLGANLGIINQTIIELTNSIISINNENTCYISKKIDSTNTDISGQIQVTTNYLANHIDYNFNTYEEKITTYVGLIIGRLEVELCKKIDNSSTVIVQEITEEILFTYTNLTNFISIENLSLSTYITNNITSAISNSVRYAIRVIIEAILENRSLNTTNFFNITKNIQEYLALLLLQIAFEIKIAIEGIRLNSDTNLDFQNNIVNNIVNTIIPIINNSFQTTLPDIITNINNVTNTTITEKVDNCCNGILDLLNLIIGLLNLFRNNGTNCPELDTSIIISLLNSILNKIDLKTTELEENLSIKIDNIDFNIDFGRIEQIINSNNNQLKIDLINDIRTFCNEAVNQIKTDLINIITLGNQNTLNLLNDLRTINTENNVLNNTINNQIQNIITQLGSMQTNITNLTSSVSNLNQTTESNFSELLLALTECCQMIETGFYNNNQFIQQNISNPLNGLTNAVSTILALIISIDTLIRTREDSERIIDIKNTLDRVEEILNVDVNGSIDISCSTNSLTSQYAGKTFIGLSNQLKSITQVLRLIMTAVCVDISGSITLECGDENVTKYFLGSGLSGVSDQLKAISDIQTVVNEKVCEAEDKTTFVTLYPAEQYDHVAIQTQLEIYFGQNYPKATGTLLPIYIPNPKANLTWNNFEPLVRNMGQEYVRIQWDNNPDIGTGVWGVSFEHLEAVGNQLINLSNDTATLRYTKGGKRKRPIIERQLRAVRAVISVMDDQGNVVETTCLIPPRS